jgi:hypothetical protein
MLEKFYEYFREIEMPSAIRERAEQLCNEFALFLPRRIDRVFVNDLYDQQGVRRYLNLELVGQSVLMECKNFILSDNIDFLNLDEGIKWIQIDKNELNNVSGETSTKSWITAYVAFEGATRGLVAGPAHGTGLVLTAYHNNCAHLAEFVKEELLTRLRPRREAPEILSTATASSARRRKSEVE